jgi:hypothetical protein
MITLKTEPWPKGAPNPPPWQVIYESDEESVRDAVPLAYTTGLIKFGHAEMRIRKAPPTLASFVLDRLGIWLTHEGGQMEAGQTFCLVLPKPSKPDTIHFFTVAELEKGLRIYRLAWHKDPADKIPAAVEAPAHP